MTKILQIDREAYARLGDYEPSSMGWRMITEPSGADCVGVAAFASHREQATRELFELIQKLERNTVELYRVIAPGGNYGANTVGSSKNENTFADADPVVIAARSALTKATPDA